MKTFLLWLFLLPLIIFLSPFIIAVGIAIYAFLYGIFFAGWVSLGVLIVLIMERING